MDPIITDIAEYNINDDKTTLGISVPHTFYSVNRIHFCLVHISHFDLFQLMDYSYMTLHKMNLIHIYCSHKMRMQWVENISKTSLKKIKGITVIGVDFRLNQNGENRL